MALNTTINTNNPGVVIFQLQGRLDAAAAIDFEPQLMSFAEDNSVFRIVIDGKDLEFVASAGLRVLLRAIKVMSPRQGKLYAAAIRDTVLSVLKITGFATFITVTHSVEDCLQP